MKEWIIAVLPGDGIGPEVTAEAERVLEAVAERFGLGFATGCYAVGAAGVETATLVAADVDPSELMST